MRLADRQDLIIVPVVALAVTARGLGSVRILRGIARLLGFLAYVASRRKRRRIERALTAAYGGSLAARDRRAIVRGSLRSVWEELFTLIAGPVARPQFQQAEIRGLDYLEAAQARGRGTILWESNGLGSRWMAKRFLLERGFPLHQVHGPENLGGFQVVGANATALRARLVGPHLDHCERFFVSGVTALAGDGSLGALRDLGRRLARNEILCIAGDGILGHNRVRVDFLGGSADFATGMVTLARASGAELLPMFCAPERGDGRLVLTIEEPIVIDPTLGREDRSRRAIECFARHLEHHVRRHPVDYRNWHLGPGSEGSPSRGDGPRTGPYFRPVRPLAIGLIGDFQPGVAAHQRIPPALRGAAFEQGRDVELTWLATDHIPIPADAALARFNALWAVPASPYASMDGALEAIRYARENGTPFLGTCGGFQHAVIEYARNVLDLVDAEHAESRPDAERPIIAPLACSLVGAAGPIRLTPGSRAAALYGATEGEERYHCSYGLAPEHRARFEAGPLRITGFDDQAEPRVVELEGHPFYLATLFQPELRSSESNPHPLIRAFIAAAAARTTVEVA